MILLKNCNYIDENELKFKKVDIVVEEGEEGKIFFSNSENNNNQNLKVIDCTGKIVSHSFANAHHHVYSALARGMGKPKKNPENFLEILEFIWWNLDKCLDDETIYASALVTAIDCAKNGVTFVIDHHSSPNSIHNSLSIIKEAFEKVGVSHLLCYEITDRDGEKFTEKALVETDSYLTNNQGLVGLHASFTLSDETLKQAYLLCEKHKTGIHIHVAEDKYDQLHCRNNFNKSVVERLDNFGFLDFEKTILAHCIHIDDFERGILSNSNCWIVQNMESNQNNRVGFFNGNGLNPDKIMFGTDGMHSDIIKSSKAAFLSGMNNEFLLPSDTYRRLRNVHNYLKINKFNGDSQNNLVVIDYNSPTEISDENFLAHFIYGIESKYITHVVSHGKLIVENRRLTTIDEDSTYEFSRKQSKKLWEAMQKNGI